ncbi:MAG: biotin synthase BioB [Halobacteria archaeon]
MEIPDPFQHPLTREQALALARLPRERLPELFAAASRARERVFGNKIHLCAIGNAKSGGCSEDCSFCSQSAHYETPVVQFPGEYPLLDKEEILRRALRAEAQGAHGFCVVAAWRGLTAGSPALRKAVEIVREMKARTRLEICLSLGIVDRESARALAEAGGVRYNHNLETSRRFFPRVCTTHTYDERVDSIRHLKEAGMEVCSGGIIGMGEAVEDRIDLALDLARLGVDEVPINFLDPRPGTPLGAQAVVKPLEALRTIALYRLLLPRQTLIVAGGRERVLRDLQPMMFLAGANGTILGDYLTTRGRSTEEDLRMLKDLGLEPEEHAPLAEPPRIPPLPPRG